MAITGVLTNSDHVQIEHDCQLDWAISINQNWILNYKGFDAFYW